MAFFLVDDLLYAHNHGDLEIHPETGFVDDSTQATNGSLRLTGVDVPAAESPGRASDLDQRSGRSSVISAPV